MRFANSNQEICCDEIVEEIKVKYIALVIAALFVFSACKKSKLGMEYRITENYEVIAGEYTGMKGESEYNIKIIEFDEELKKFSIENFAKAYNVNSFLRGDSIFIPSQKFPYYDSHVTIEGKGKIFKDSLQINYFSGGPQGQIDAKCVGRIIHSTK